MSKSDIFMFNMLSDRSLKTLYGLLYEDVLDGVPRSVALFKACKADLQSRDIMTLEELSRLPGNEELAAFITGQKNARKRAVGQ